MAIQLMVRINRNSTVTFNPNPLSANTLDQIFWVNNDDTEAHWPGLVKSDGNIDATFFMPNQIAPGGDSSPIFSPSTAATLDYACSLHADETGSLIIT